MSTSTRPTSGVMRRTVLKAGAAAMVALGAVTPASAHERGGSTDADEVDSPEGFDVEILSAHATFTDHVSASFRTEYHGGDMGTVVSELPTDASSVVVAKVTWEPEGTSGWHTHPGPVVVSVAEGELELVNERDCVVRTYTAGEAFIDPGQGNVHIASNPSEDGHAVAYATFLGVPDGAPATTWVEPVDC